MIWSLILYGLLLLFATKMILKLAPPARPRRRVAVQPNAQLCFEFEPIRLPSREKTAFVSHCEDVAVEERELVGV